MARSDFEFLPADNVVLPLDWMPAAEIEDQWNATQSALLEPNLNASREQSAHMLANPSSLAFSLMAIAILACHRTIEFAARNAAKSSSTSATPQHSRRRAA